MPIESALFAAGLIAAFYFASVSGRPHMRRTAVILVCVWVALLLSSYNVDKEYRPIIRIFADAIAASVLLQHPAMRLQAAIGLVYGIQIVAHFTYLVNPWGGYMWFLALGGWFQISIVIWGSLHGRGKRLAAGGYSRGDIGEALANDRHRLAKRKGT